MDAPHTVVIVGAGASSPYGFPLGKDLLHRMQRELSDPIVGRPDLPHDAPDTERSRTLRTELLALTPSIPARRFETIDQYLDGAGEDAKLRTKRGMAYTFLRGERAFAYNVHQPKPAGDWYTDLFEQMLAASDSEIAGTQFLTFNYERSLQYDLWESIVQEGVRTGKRRWSDLPIRLTHLYGAVGWPLDTGALERIKASEYLTVDQIQDAAGQIRTYSDDHAARWQQPREWIASARRLVFLGFGFHASNLSNLGISGTGPVCAWRQTGNVWSTSKIRTSERGVMEKRLGLEVRWSGDCAQTLRKLGSVFKPEQGLYARAVALDAIKVVRPSKATLAP
jgi:hypothetical protein